MSQNKSKLKLLQSCSPHSLMFDHYSYMPALRNKNLTSLEINQSSSKCLGFKTPKLESIKYGGDTKKAKKNQLTIKEDEQAQQILKQSIPNLYENLDMIEKSFSCLFEFTKAVIEQRNKLLQELRNSQSLISIQHTKIIRLNELMEQLKILGSTEDNKTEKLKKIKIKPKVENYKQNVGTQTLQDKEQVQVISQLQQENNLVNQEKNNKTEETYQIAQKQITKQQKQITKLENRISEYFAQTKELDDCKKTLQGMNESKKDLFDEIKYLRGEIKRIKTEWQSEKDNQFVLNEQSTTKQQELLNKLKCQNDNSEFYQNEFCKLEKSFQEVTGKFQGVIQKNNEQYERILYLEKLCMEKDTKNKDLYIRISQIKFLQDENKQKDKLIDKLITDIEKFENLICKSKEEKEKFELELIVKCNEKEQLEYKLEQQLDPKEKGKNIDQIAEKRAKYKKFKLKKSDEKDTVEINLTDQIAEYKKIIKHQDQKIKQYNLQKIDNFSESLKMLREKLNCDLCSKIMKSPVTCIPCGHSFCFNCKAKFSQFCLKCGQNEGKIDAVYRNEVLDEFIKIYSIFHKKESLNSFQELSSEKKL